MIFYQIYEIIYNLYKYYFVDTLLHNTGNTIKIR